ncbi:hypothetical protein ABEF95_000326 [Exophiala dermatitidis]
MSSYLVTGSTRGLGLNIVASLAGRPETQVSRIFATGRSHSAALDELVKAHPHRVIYVQLDVARPETIKAAVDKVRENVSGDGLDVLVNNAGILTYTENGIANMTDLMSTVAVNVEGVQQVTRAFVPLLEQGYKKTVVNISTILASLTYVRDTGFQQAPAYKISKTALNMLTSLYAQEYETKGFIFVAVNPGWCQTDMGSSSADLPVEAGVKGILGVIDKLTPKDNGKFLTIEVPGWEAKGKLNPYQGGELAW